MQINIFLKKRKNIYIKQTNKNWDKLAVPPPPKEKSMNRTKWSISQKKKKNKQINDQVQNRRTETDLPLLRGDSCYHGFLLRGRKAGVSITWAPQEAKRWKRIDARLIDHQNMMVDQPHMLFLFHSDIPSSFHKQDLQQYYFLR